jgi:hypothetical protein
MFCAWQNTQIRQFNDMVHDSIEEQAKTLPMYSTSLNNSNRKGDALSQPDALQGPPSKRGFNEKVSFEEQSKNRASGESASSSKAKNRASGESASRAERGEQGQSEPHRPNDECHYKGHGE